MEGNVRSKIKIGLFYCDELVSVLTLQKKKGEVYEILRFCNMINILVVDGMKNLVNFFIKTYKPSSIIVCVDRRYSQGNSYLMLNFKFIQYTNPTFYYFNNKIKKPIRHIPKKFIEKNPIIVDMNSIKSKHQTMIDMGYLRIYNCGFAKFELKFE